jgi:hypothetical protein
VRVDSWDRRSWSRLVILILPPVVVVIIVIVAVVVAVSVLFTFFADVSPRCSSRKRDFRGILFARGQVGVSRAVGNGGFARGDAEGGAAGGGGCAEGGI